MHNSLHCRARRMSSEHVPGFVSRLEHGSVLMHPHVYRRPAAPQLMKSLGHQGRPLPGRYSLTAIKGTAYCIHYKAR